MANVGLPWFGWDLFGQKMYNLHPFSVCHLSMQGKTNKEQNQIRSIDELSQLIDDVSQRRQTQRLATIASYDRNDSGAPGSQSVNSYRRFSTRS
ncbi:hypothetical protein DERP_006694 [Dermatophagoides pteronyssinus]|uniref:Uncharacterized protein n=1 Tax=Dermatophagoides pteronyssinus TaxID=6956 RepID=A0ABQ8IR71_DERPT|nr:hypothetical protein DERP_006694 [Dermatophagoides pteronyssinus]